MPIKVYKPNRAARKRMSAVDRSALYSGPKYRPLRGGSVRDSGRGRDGKITVRHRGGGVKRVLRSIDFGQAKLGVAGRVERIEYDPNRTSFIALLLDSDGERRYVLSWAGAKVGDKVITASDAPERPGNRMQLKNVTPGSTVFNVELAPGRGGSMFRSAGSYGTVMDVQENQVLLKLPSSEVRVVSLECWGTVGEVSNADHRLVRIGSAGRNRRRGKRPAVRGKVMNPVDHPHGGGEGAQSIGMKHPKTPWGKPALGVKTRQKNKSSNRFIVTRRKSKKRK